MKRSKLKKQNFKFLNKLKKTPNKVKYLLSWSSLEAEAERVNSKIKAQGEAEVEAIENQRKLLRKESQKKEADIENQIFLEREKARADADHYTLMKTIEAEQSRLSEKYLQKLAIESLTQNTKLYFGESIPDFIQENIHGLQHMTKGQKQGDG